MNRSTSFWSDEGVWECLAAGASSDGLINPMFPTAWEGLAESCRRLHDQARAEQCLTTAKQVRDSLAWQQVVADIRRNYPFWR